MTSRIPCTVAILTFNNAATLGRALESVADVEEVIVSDGGSTDGTQDLVLRYGRTLVEQPDSAKGPEGRLVDFGAARDHIRKLAVQPWIMELGSDDYVSRDLIMDFRRVCVDDGSVNMYTIRAQYELDGRLIDCATTYPMYLPRLFRTKACTGYVGLTNERAVVPGLPVRLESCYVIPVAPTKVIARKWLHYLSLDQRECRDLSPADLAKRSAYTRSQIRWFARDFKKIWFGGSCESRLPIHREMLRVGFYLARHTLTLTERVRRQVVGARTRNG